MTKINDIPLMFQAQIRERCQLQYAQSEDAKNWVSQWTQYGATGEYDFGTEVQTKTYQISWRFVTNGGQDDGIIRPVIGANGMPFYPGSSMKGAFRQACELAEKVGNLPSGTCNYYCGDEKNLEPGILRFHGGYPTNNWKQQLLDIVHPQQGWQVKELNSTKKPKEETAHPLISLYQPELKFGISSSKSDINWEQVWDIWQKALGYGIGCRVSGGYGLSNQVKVEGEILYQVKLQGQGIASQNLQRQPEFRFNMFRATLRSHALRIFGGLNLPLAEDIVDDLFGGIRSHKEKVGLLRVVFVPDSLDVPDPLDVLEKDKTTYKVTGDLLWILFREYPSTMTDIDQQNLNDALKKLVKSLTQFAMLLGGFGKSWRRADHKEFYPKYKKHSIGCHWQWSNPEDNPIAALKDKKQLIKEAEEIIKQTVLAAQKWLELKYPNSQKLIDKSQKSFPSKPNEKPQQPVRNKKWREAWQEDNVQVWGRIANNKDDSKVILWLHDSQKSSNFNNNLSPKNSNVNPAAIARTNKSVKPPIPIYRTCLTGRVKDASKSNEPTAIGRLWHRMYPLQDDRYLELIVIFPKECEVAESFVTWLNSSQSTFTKLEWSN